MTTQQHKAFEVEFKAMPATDPNSETGRFSAIVSVFGNVDVQGDRVMPGAFKDTISKWSASGDKPPVIWSHDWGNPFAHIGQVVHMEETEKGLLVEGEIDLTNAFAAQVYNLMKRRAVREFSFGYRILKEKTASDGANNLEILDLIEVGPTLKGANPDTQLLGVKAELEAAARPSTVIELQQRLFALEAKLDELLNTTSAQEAGTGIKGNTEDPATGNVEDLSDPDLDLKLTLQRLVAETA